jgi:hypothetical protein
MFVKSYFNNVLSFSPDKSILIFGKIGISPRKQGMTFFLTKLKKVKMKTVSLYVLKYHSNPKGEEESLRSVKYQILILDRTADMTDVSTLQFDQF